MQDIIFKSRIEAIYKVIVIGDPDVGKEDLLIKLTTNRFEENYLRTVGVQISKKTIELKEFEATVVAVEGLVWRPG